MSFSLLRLLPLAFVLSLAAVSAPCQCPLQWQPGDPVSMPRGDVAATVTWDPDGAGPAPLVLVAAGSFWIGSVRAHVATWNGTQWTSLGTPLSINGHGAGTALAIYNGELVLAGRDGGTNGLLCRYTAGAWQTFGTCDTAVNYPTVEAMAVFNNQLVVAGRFDTMVGFTANNIASWNGSTWSPLGSGVDGWVGALAVYTHAFQSALYVGGSFWTAGGVTTRNLAVWTGATWVATAGCDGTVTCLGVRLTAAVTTSHLFVGGYFANIGGSPFDRIARYNTATNAWSPLGTLPGNPLQACASLFVRATGMSAYEIVARVESSTQMVRWNGSAWSNLGPSLQSVFDDAGWPGSQTPRSVSYFNGQYVVALGDYWGLQGGVLAFDGTTWRTRDGTGIDRRVKAVAATASDLVIGGTFRSISGVAMNGVARGGPNAWQPLGNGVTGGVGEVNAVAALPNGDVIAAGSFSLVAGGVADRIARWNGSSWQSVGGGTNGTVHALAVMPNGDVVAGGSFSFAGSSTVQNLVRWNGAFWAPLGQGCNGAVRALRVAADGSLLVGGMFTSVGNGVAANRVARWNGSWQPFGTGVDGAVNALAETPDGDVVAVGEFGMAGGFTAMRIARWNGAAWIGYTFGSGSSAQTARAVEVLPDGDILYACDRSLVTVAGGGMTYGSLFRIRGGVFSPLPLTQGAIYSTPDVLHAITRTPAGEIVIAGYFHVAGNQIAANVARLVTPCPASASTYGAGCAGSGGINTLVAKSLPWEGSTLRTRATGLPTAGVALAIFGFTQFAIPLAALLPEGAPGCDLLTTPDVMLVGLPTGGTLDTNLFLSPSPSVVGATFFHQVVTFQDFGSPSLAITSTNALSLHGGAF